MLTDLKVLDLGIPLTYIDTTWLDQGNPRKLKTLVRDQLNAAIQGEAHSSVTDARSAMALFKLHKDVLVDKKVIYDPRISESSKPRRNRGSKGLENINPNFVNPKKPDFEKQLANAILAIEDHKKYSISKKQVKILVAAVTRQRLLEAFALL